MASDSRGKHRPKGLRVIVIEDETLVALLLESMLEELGHNVVGIAANVSSALELVRLNGIDLAILDVNVGGQDSYPVADALAARNVPFVFATGYDADRLHAQYRGGSVLHKPFMQRDLERAIGRACI